MEKIMKILKYILVVSLLALPFSGFSANLICSNPTTSIYFINGITNSTKDARNSLKRIKTAYKGSFSSQYPRQSFEFKLAYNISRHYDADVRETVQQKLEERNLLGRSRNSEEYQPWQLVDLYRNSPEYFKNNVPSEFQFLGEIIDTEIKNRCSPPSGPPDRVVTLNDHLAKYRADLAHGKRIILIPHSQGNLFANSALRELRGKYADNIGMIGVASTVAILYPNTFYVTAKDDSVINYMRTGEFHFFYTGKIGKFSVLPGNVDNKHATHWRDILKHAFYKSYFFHRLKSRKIIDEHMDYYLKTLKFPIITNNTGALMATLTWESASSDVDLHVKEASGTNVYYGNKVGVNGYLDKDVTSGKGPEHYFASCSSPIEGEYLIQAKYYSGTGSEKATIQVDTERGNSYSVTKTFTSSSSSSNPVKFMTVKVEPDPANTGKYIYKISE